MGMSLQLLVSIEVMHSSLEEHHWCQSVPRPEPATVGVFDAVKMFVCTGMFGVHT